MRPVEIIGATSEGLRRGKWGAERGSKTPPANRETPERGGPTEADAAHAHTTHCTGASSSSRFRTGSGLSLDADRTDTVTRTVRASVNLQQCQAHNPVGSAELAEFVGLGVFGVGDRWKVFRVARTTASTRQA